MVSCIGAYYRQTKQTTTISALRASALDGLAVLLADWVNQAASASAAFEIGRARTGSKSYFADNLDLYDYMTEAGKADPGLKKACEAVKRYLSEKLVVANAANLSDGSRDASSHGVSIYFPWYYPLPRYGDTVWAKATRWDDYIRERTSAEQ